MKILISESLLSWEKELLAPLQVCLSGGEPCSIEPLNESKKYRAESGERYWVLCNQWYQIAKMSDFSLADKVYFSALSFPSDGQTFLPWLFWKAFRLPRKSKFFYVAHCPFAARYLKEIQGLPASQVLHLPLPYSAREGNLPPKGPMIGVVARYVPESSLNYVLSVAHYVNQKLSSAQFVFVGTGPQRNHLENSIQALGLSQCASLSEEMPKNLSAVIFSSLQNPHFLPVYLAGMNRAAIIAAEVPGIAGAFQDGKEGFVVPVHEIKPMGELILRCLVDHYLPQAMGEGLHKALQSRFSPERLKPFYHVALESKVDPKSMAATGSRAA